ncbi:MAG: hypothetical protein WA001_04725 [Patescibacteria group bacterium]
MAISFGLCTICLLTNTWDPPLLLVYGTAWVFTGQILLKRLWRSRQKGSDENLGALPSKTRTWQRVRDIGRRL